MRVRGVSADMTPDPATRCVSRGACRHADNEPEGVGRSEKDDCARTRSLTRFERRDRLWAAERKVRDEIGCRKTQGASVVARVSDEENHDILAIVSAFQGSPARTRLHISQSRFGIDGNVPVVAKDGRVPCAPIAGNPEWHLRPPAETRSEAVSELAQQRQLGSVANRLAGRIDAQWEVQPQHRGEHHQRFERDPWSLAQLDAADLGVRNPDRGAHLSLSQSCAEPRLA
jgi:hypothetical protein